MAIWEVKDLIKLPLEELIGSLMTHEITIEKQGLEKKPNKNLAFKIVCHVDDDDDDDEGGAHCTYNKIILKFSKKEARE